MQKPMKDAVAKQNDGPVVGKPLTASLEQKVNGIGVVPERIVEPRSIRIPFFRWFGPTGIAPGYKKMLFDVKHLSQQYPDDIGTPSTPDDEAKIHTSLRESAAASLFEADGITPASRVLGPLLNTFFDHYGCHFPFYRRDAFTALVKDRKVSALVLNSICGLSARFSPLPEFQDCPLYLRGDIFAQKAKVLLVPLLNLPSYDVVASILMLVWLELASNHDVGVWMYMGMACRMAMDLGMHRAAISGPDKLVPEEYWTVSRTWFSVHHLDHIISFATGRPLSIERKYIDVPWPRIDSDAELPSPFPCMVVIMQTLGLLHDELNDIDQLEELADSTREKLFRYNDELINYYAHLPPALSFDIHNFQSYVATGESGTYLMLHLWFHAIVIGLHRPGLRYGQETRAKSICLTPESRGIALSSARTMTSILSLVEVVDTGTLVSSPFIDQAVEVAGLVFIAESTSTSNPLRRITNRSNYEICLRTLRRLITYWKGVSWVTTTMEQQAEGIRETDPAEGSVDPHSLIELQDTKMIQKLFEKMQQSMPSRTVTKAQESIGVGFSGLTNDSGPGSVMILQPNSPSIRDQMHSTGRSRSPPVGARKYCFPEQHFTSESALIGGESWHSWIDDRFWEDLDLTFETLPD
ncbi:hypothetical protein LTR99_006581 [Exophiala xenobiotica]|uniref:Xylanolytic transcriptional activator regulatory domain-containing protein n=1 Tax=Vermiconidia calcicola TaxID=1690605 RepID=A0AAV9QAY6_9PEZI|nr:hypothetical protein LTR96_007426 [Exophiala xenobiotica]KAK5301614.1 hypothetical protein LTR99_006581 [Exophiala xenobiotica]KAK5335134.1 hypothetical protein LTR98_008854 [Exophiala xenobiotica]KAK5528774.1 hypothetical protein LTR23_010921 [Chaetothyriales sp. CCFEE 6169]KAK5537751.1 hypothetical protein LTR25_005003 [Vermiconidia calcicola]